MCIEKDQKKNTESIWPHEKRQNNNHVFKLKNIYIYVHLDAIYGFLTLKTIATCTKFEHCSI